MKIAFIVGGFPCLSETFILNQITALISSGHEVEIVALENPEERKIHPDVDKYNLIQKTTYFPGIPSNKLYRILKGFILFLSHFPKNPLRMLQCLNFFRYGKDALSLKLLFYNSPVLNKKFDILHCHFGQNGMIGACLKKGGAGVRLLTTFHGYDLSEYVHISGPGIYRDLFRVCDRCLPISEHWKCKLMQMGCQEERITVHHMGIDVNRFEFQQKKILRGEKIKLLTVGRLVEKKGHEYSIRAIAKVLHKTKNVEYIIAGNGPLKNKLENLARQLGINSQVHFLGECNQSEVLELYLQAHIFILPSITSESGDQEGIPVVLMEAQAMGMPVISTLHSGIPEGVLDGQSGYLVPEKDVSALSERIGYLISHHRIWTKMGRKGRAFVEKEFNQHILNQQLEGIFKNTLRVK